VSTGLRAADVLQDAFEERIRELGEADTVG